MYIVTISENIFSLVITAIIFLTYRVSIKAETTSDRSFIKLVIINFIALLACLFSYSLVQLNIAEEYFYLNGIALFIIFTIPAVFFTELLHYISLLTKSKTNELDTLFYYLNYGSIISTVLIGVLGIILAILYPKGSVFDVPLLYGLIFAFSCVFVMLLVFYSILKSKQYIEKKSTRTLVIMMLLMIVGFVFAIIFPDNHLTTVTTLSLLILFMFIQNDRINISNLESVKNALHDAEHSKNMLENSYHLLEQSYENLEEEKRRVDAIASIFHTMYTIDMKNDRLINLGKTTDLIKQLVSDSSGLDVQTIINNVMEKITHPDYLKSALDFVDLSKLEDRMKDKYFITFEVVNFHNNWWRFMFIRVGDKNSPLHQVIFTSLFINDEKLKEENLIRSSTIDELTGIYNRNAYIKHTKDIKIRDDLCYICVDLNGLKTANDNLGHEAGDEMLIATGQILKQACGKSGKVYRTGGDEFVVILNTDKTNFDRILTEIENLSNKWHGKIVDRLTFSLGCVIASELVNPTLDDISKIADKRMYDNKRMFYDTNKNMDRRTF